MSRRFHAFALVLAMGASAATGLTIVVPAFAQNAAAPAAQSKELQAAIHKSNAYIGLMNRTLRASQSWGRYTSWVNVKTGPTGRERYIDYGLYSLYDVRDEIAKALAATNEPPQTPEIDASMKRYIEAYQVLAPLITQAEAYYERKDYKDDNMAEGKALHVKLVPAAEAFLKERAVLDRQMRGLKADISRVEIAAIEAAEGKKARWHVKNVMMNAEAIIELLPNNASPVVNMPPFDEALARYATAVREMDTYSQANPGQFSSFDSQPRSLLGKLRDFRDKLARAKGDARRGAGQDMTWIVNDYNMMITISQHSLRFSR